MDIQTFSQTYWYIWFLAVLLIVILFIINGIGLFLYHKRRQRFLNQINEIHNSIPMRETSTVSTIDMNRLKYKQISIPSMITSTTFSTNTQSYLSSSIPKITTIHEINEIDSSLKEFQKQALEEHNSIRMRFNKPLLKLSELLNSSAQHWAEQCVQTNRIQSSKSEWRLKYNEQPLGENIISIKCADIFDGIHFTSLLMTNGNQSTEVECILNELTTEVGFGRASDDTQQQWVGVAHYYPYRQLTTVQS